MRHVLTLYHVPFQSRDWKLSMPRIQLDSIICTLWYKLRLKLIRLSHHPVVPMDFCGSQGKEHQAPTI